MSFACRPVGFSGTGVVSPVPVTTVSDTAVDPGDAIATMTFNSNGTITLSGNLSAGGSNWRDPTQTGVGSSFWIRATKTAGTTHNIGATLDTWHSASGAVAFGWSQTTTGTKSATYTIEIATDSAGTNIVATKTGINIFVEVDII